MKMVKKILFTIAVVAFLAASVQAVDPGKYKLKFDESSDPSYTDHPYWPYEYIYVALCEDIKIYMDVGYFVQMEKCGDYKIKLKQVTCSDIGKSNTGDFPCYYDCENIKVRANFDAKLSGEVETLFPAWFKEDKTKVVYEQVEEGDEPYIVPGDGGWHVKRVCVRAWDVEIWESGGTGDDTGLLGKGEAHVGYLTITVKPLQ